MRGYSAADAVTGLVLLTLTIVSLYQVMIPSFALWRNSDERIARQQDVRLALDRLARSLHESSVAFGFLRGYNCSGPSQNENCTAIGFVTARENCTGQFRYTGAGTPNWQAAVYIWWDATSGELRQYCAVGSNPAPTLPLGLSPFTIVGQQLSQVSFTLCNPCSPVTPSTSPVALAVALEERATTATRPTYRYQTNFFNQTIFLPVNR